MRQRSRRFGRATGARTRSTASDCIVRTVLFGAAPLKFERRKMVKYAVEKMRGKDIVTTSTYQHFLSMGSDHKEMNYNHLITEVLRKPSDCPYDEML